MYALPGKKLLFMGGEFGQREEWCHDGSSTGSCSNDAPHQGVQRWIADLNAVYRGEPALFELDFQPEGFEWIDCHDADTSVLSFFRKASDAARHPILAVFNFTPIPRDNYRVGAPFPGFWREILNSDAAIYGGSGLGNLGSKDTIPILTHGRPQSLALTLPPLAAIYLRHEVRE